MAATQPIALRSVSNSHPVDYPMDGVGSFSGSSPGPFNPASYTRHFIGSPISWRAGSFGMPGSIPMSSSWSTRLPVGSPTHRLLSSWEAGKTPSSMDSDRGSILNAFNVFDREGELCRNYTCCGQHLDDLHALLEHFEEVHIVVVDPNSPQPQAQIQVPFNPQINELTPQQQQEKAQRQSQLQQNGSFLPQQRQGSQQHPFADASQPPTPFDPDDMELELDLDTSMPVSSQALPPQSSFASHPNVFVSSSRSSPSSGAPTPPDTPISTPLSAYPSPHAFAPNHLPNGISPFSQPSSPLSGTAVSTRQSSPTGTSTSSNGHTIRPNLNLNFAYHQRSNFGCATNTTGVITHPEEAFNAYARFASDYSSSLPGAQFNGANVDEASAIPWQQLQAMQQQQQQQQQQAANQQQVTQVGCLPPALLFAPSASCTPASTPGGSRVPSPTLQGQSQQASSPMSAPANKASAGASVAPHRADGNHSAPASATVSSTGSGSSTAHPSTTSLLRPGSSLLLSKPFRCPKPNCNKSYKQANGLKYHMTHGSCNFAPPKDLEHVKDLLERKRREREAQAQANGGAGLNRSLSLGANGYSGSNSGESSNGGGLPATLDTALLSSYYDLNLQSMNITETELREVEREAEKRLRPFACGVGDCQRRYKNMNGLRYHYQHSGDHGAVGLALLASGQHECLQGQKRGHHSNTHSSNSHSSSTSSSTLANSGSTSTASALDDEREGRKRFLMKAGVSASVPVSRAPSTSRTGTPIPVVATGGVPVHPASGTASVPVSTTGSTNTSPNLKSGVLHMPVPSSSSSSLSGALGNTTTGPTSGSASPSKTTSPLTSPLQVVQVNGVGINTGLPQQRQSQQQPSQQQQQQQQATSTSPSQQQQQQMQQQMAAAAAYHFQYSQEIHRQYQVAMMQQIQAQQQQQQQQQGQVQGQAQHQQSQRGQSPGSPQHQQQSPQSQQEYGMFDGVMSMDMS